MGENKLSEFPVSAADHFNKSIFDALIEYQAIPVQLNSHPVSFWKSPATVVQRKNARYFITKSLQVWSSHGVKVNPFWDGFEYENIVSCSQSRCCSRQRRRHEDTELDPLCVAISCGSVDTTRELLGWSNSIAAHLDQHDF